MVVEPRGLVVIDANAAPRAGVYLPPCSSATRVNALIDFSQEALLPAEVPVLPEVSLAARYLVAAEDQAAGGDWFDAVPLPDGAVALVVGDIVGHGVQASAAMGRLRAVLGELLADGVDLGPALARVDRLAARTPSMRATTVCVAVLDPVTVRCATAPVGTPRRWSSRRTVSPATSSRPAPARWSPGSALPVRTETLRPGEVLALFSDGLVERAGQPL